MNSHAFALALVACTFALADLHVIAPDWDKLTDFTTSMAVDLDPIIAFSNKAAKGNSEEAVKQGCPPDECTANVNPVKSLTSSGTVRLDVPGERFKVTATGNFEYADSTSRGLPPPLQGAKGSGAGLFAFDAKGFVVMKEKGSVSSPRFGDFSYEFCARVHFPQGLLPPGKAVMAQLDQQKSQITAQLNQFPHREATVDGSDVALFEKPGRKNCERYDYSHYHGGGPAPCLKYGTRQAEPDQYAAVMFDGTPVGYGLNPPADGKWNDAVVKFSGWTKGAGSIEDEECVQMSATELLQSHHANRSLLLFDQVVSLLKSQEPLSSALAFIPVQPSQIFASAARLENLQASTAQFNEDAKVQISSAPSWGTMAMAAVGGLVGASLVLIFSKSSRAVMRAPALLG